MTIDKEKGNKYIWCFFALAHFFLSFIYERSILVFDCSMSDLGWSVPINHGLPENVERMIVYGIGKIEAFFIIAGIWYLLFKVLSAEIPRHIVILFGVLWVVGQVLLIFSWPETSYGCDQFATYLLAVRLLPWYWQSAFTTTIYVASFMVFPHAITLTLLQYFAFIVVIGYFYYRIERSFKPRLVFKIGFLLIFLAPETFKLMTSPHRTCLYTLLSIGLVTFVVMEYVDKCCFSRAKMIIGTFMSMLVMVWRTEGIFVGFICFLILMLAYRPEKKKAFFYSLSFLLTFFLLFSFQSIGNDKYYGKSYLVVSTIPALQNILNSPDVNLDYSGVEENLALLEQYYPVARLQEHGVDGWRVYNQWNGYEDFDQTGKPEDIENGYVKATAGLILHNFDIYSKTQVKCALDALGIKNKISFSEYEGESTEIGALDFSIAYVGVNEYFATFQTQSWVDSLRRLAVKGKLDEKKDLFEEYINKYNIPLIVRIIILIGIILVMGCEIVRNIKKNHFGIIFVMLSIALLAEFMVIVALMPVFVRIYFYEVIYVGYFVEIIYVLLLKKLRSDAISHKETD